MILFLPHTSLNTQFIFSKHVESVILLWKYFVPMQNHFCEISFHSENAPNKLTICLFLCELLSHACSYLFSKASLSRCDRPRCLWLCQEFKESQCPSVCHKALKLYLSLKGLSFLALFKVTLLTLSDKQCLKYVLRLVDN